MSTAQEWFAAACRVLGPLPADYFVIDLETSGLSAGDIPLQIGWAMVSRGNLISNQAVVLDWGSEVDRFWLSGQIRRTKSQVETDAKTGAASGHHYNFSIERMAAEGKPFRGVLADFFSLADECVDGGMTLVCHNGIRVDLAMLNRVRQHFFNTLMKDGRYLDTMAIERAVQKAKLPEPGEQWRNFCERVYFAGGGKIKSSLLDHCLHKYKLDDPNNVALRGHEADYDCLLTHRLVETYRGLCPSDKKGI